MRRLYKDEDTVNSARRQQRLDADDETLLVVVLRWQQPAIFSHGPMAMHKTSFAFPRICGASRSTLFASRNIAHAKYKKYTRNTCAARMHVMRVKCGAKMFLLCLRENTSLKTLLLKHIKREVFYGLQKHVYCFFFVMLASNHTWYTLATIKVFFSACIDRAYKLLRTIIELSTHVLMQFNGLWRNEKKVRRSLKTRRIHE